MAIFLKLILELHTTTVVGEARHSEVSIKMIFPLLKNMKISKYSKKFFIQKHSKIQIHLIKTGFKILCILIKNLFDKLNQFNIILRK